MSSSARRHNTQPPSAILITGASSGLGAGLAKAYARPGATLFLSGRDRGRLEAVAAACRELGGEVNTAIIDVTDREATAQWATSCDRVRPLDLVIANAGISAAVITGGADEDEAQTRATFAVNVDGVLNTVLPVLAPMRARRAGQIALMSSLAAFRGLPGSQGYCASKAAVRLWGEGLRAMLAPEGIRVSVICPGFVDTPMTQVNTCPMPFLMDVEAASRLIVSGLAADRGRIAFPRPTYLITLLSAALPGWLIDLISPHLPRKR
jgi:short-subunit dehydrogenase